MTDSLKMAKLDWLSTKVYIKQMFISFLIVTVAMISTMPAALNVVYFVLVNNFLLYPFVVEEQHGMNRFYHMIATTQKSRVLSKYIELVIGIGVMSVILIPINLIGGRISGEVLPKEAIVMLILIGVTVIVLLESIQIPVCFKYGYTKSKIVIILLPLTLGFGLPLIGWGLGRLMPQADFMQLIENFEVFMGQYIWQTTGVILIALVGILCISYRVALKLCPK